MADPATLPPRQLIALALGLTRPEPGGFAKPEPERSKPLAHAVLTALDKLA